MSGPTQESLTEAVRLLNEAEQTRYPGDPYRHREDATEAQVLATVLDEHKAFKSLKRWRSRMAVRNYTIATCDRCGGTQEIRSGTEAYSWGRIAINQINGPVHHGKSDKPLDICASCLREIDQWMRNP